MLVVSSKGDLGCQAGCRLAVSCSDCGRIVLGSWSDRARIVVGSCSDDSRIGPLLEMTFHLFSKILSEILQCHFFGRRSIWRRWRGTPVAPRTVNEVSNVMRIQHVSLSA